MALTRSFSGPGGLSINTNSANSLFSGSGATQSASGGMFGSTQAAKPSTNLFGASTTTSTPQTGGLFGSTTSAAPATSNLFGSAPAAATSAPATGGLFGSAPAQPASGGLFGNTNTSQPASTSGGLFGSSTAATTAPSTGGLFGTATTSNNQTQGAPSGGLFGSAAGGTQANNQTAGASTGGGLFGNTATSQPAQNGGGLFGNLNQTKPAPSGGLFGAKSTNSTSSSANILPFRRTTAQNQQQGQSTQNMLGGSRFSGQAQQQPQLVPGVRIDLSQMRGTTRFNDLHEDLQKQIEYYDKVIQSQIGMKNDCDAIMPQHGKLLEHVPNDVEFCRRKLLGMEEAMERDAADIDQNKALRNKTQALLARRSGRVYQEENPIQELGMALLEFEQSILQVAGKIGASREGIQALQLGNFTGPGDRERRVKVQGGSEEVVGWIGAFIQREMKDSRLEIDVSGRTDEWQELRSLDHEDICSSSA
ncbi:hypothetical protein EYC84_000580 [Monilinia fructicola]|uniref:Nucleoporin Nup54 alpha-helical domain-containing protein n=1 Tax=Monilinia fructicola TaxID=38448 RepID=A0A5M9JT57_MONFR|nr:hypothetical protein EYC84_000580 [Monilinia fructicola]